MRRFAKPWVIGLVTAGLGIALALTQAGVTLEERFGLSWLFWARGPMPPPSDVMVVSLDRRSAEQLNLPEKIRDWPRTLHATLIERLTKANVSTIVFDLILERERDPAQDAALAEAIAEAERVVLFEALDLQRQPIPAVNSIPLGLVETERLRQPLPAMTKAAAGLGPFPLPIVPDRVSQFWAFKPGAGGRPTLPATALQRHALPVHAEWLTLLRQAGFDGVDELPTSASKLGRAIELRQMMTRLRQAFRVDTTLGKRLRAQLGTTDLDVTQRRLLRALIALYDGPDSRYINFYGPAGQLRTRSLHEFIETEAPSKASGQNTLSDHVVFVGQSELYEPHNDAFITVFSRPNGVQVSGVEIAATAFANLLHGHLLEPSAYWLILIGMFGLMIGMVAGILPAMVAIPCALGLALLYFLGAQVSFSRENLWLPVTIPLLVQLPLGLFAGLFLQYREVRHAKANISRAIRYYLPEKVTAGFAETSFDPATVEEEAYSICMISDAGGFTHLAESMTSRKLKPFLDDYLETIFTTVERHGGTVIDVAGDGINSVWPSPSPDPTIAAKACSAALEIDRAVRAFNQRHHPLSLPTRIGLQAGQVTLGNVGGGSRFAYTVVGDAINTASRIEQLNKHLGTRLLATEAVVRGLDGVHTRALGRFKLVGKEEVLDIVEVFGPEEAGRQQELVNRFADALAYFQERRWEKAADLFAAIASELEDGAAGFYFETCRLYSGEAIKPHDPCVISLRTK